MWVVFATEHGRFNVDSEIGKKMGKTFMVFQ